MDKSGRHPRLAGVEPVVAAADVKPAGCDCSQHCRMSCCCCCRH
jgi:hypothetical protein